MPLYEYQCQACGDHFEVRQRFSDAPLESCRRCGGAVQKMISKSAFALKGGGWYQQGYSQQSTSACPAAQSKSSSACESCPQAANA